MISDKGLTSKEVVEMKKKYGNNQISEGKKNSFFRLLIESLGDPIIKILLVALAIKIVFLFKNFDYYETLGILIAVFLASFISSISEYGSEKAFLKLQEESSNIYVKVIRDGKIQNVYLNDIVKNDIILLTSGDKVPADALIISGELLVNESLINGETKEVKKTLSQNINDKNREHIVFRGSVIYDGYAKCLVTEIGERTMYGSIFKSIQEKSPESPLKKRLREFAKIISKIGYIGAILVTISFLFSEIIIKNDFEVAKIIATITNPSLMFNYFLYALTLCVTIIVVAVPEGLPMMITLVLSSNMKRMLKDNVLVRKMVGIETSGSLNLLLSDKTGTITKGELEVTCFIDSNNITYKKLSDLKKKPKYYEIIRNSLYYNNRSEIGLDNKPIGGNITDKAIIKYVDYKPDIKYKKNKEKLFNSNIKYSSTLINDENKTCFYKGASEIIISKCSTYLDSNGNKKILYNKKLILDKIGKYTSQGIRVLALAYKENTDVPDIQNGLTYLGFILINDEIRAEAIEGLKLVTDAGIQTIMITGDSKDTAFYVAKQIGLITSDKDIVLTSEELSKMNDYDIQKMIPNIKVIARSLPSDKKRIVQLAQDKGLIVGMTGDGINDAPALKKADVGFAMGSGSDVSKEASDIVILDNNFLSISKAILYGRTIFKSIRKFVIFQSTVNMCALMLSIIGPFIGINTPITIIQMLWINMIMDTFAGIAFSFEPPLKDYMSESPKSKNEPIVNKYMYSQILFTGMYSALICVLFLKLPIIQKLIRFDYNNKFLMTAYFGLFIFMGVFNAFNARTSRINILSHLKENKIFILIIIFILSIQTFLIYNGGNLFRTYGLSLFEFLLILVISFSVIPFDIIRKIIIKKLNYNKSV